MNYEMGSTNWRVTTYYTYMSPRDPRDIINDRLQWDIINDRLQSNSAATSRLDISEDELSKLIFDTNGGE